MTTTEPAATTETAEEKKARIRSQGYVAADFAPFMHWHNTPPLPNLELIDVAVAASIIAAGAGLLAEPLGASYARVEGEGHAHWARYFYNTTQRGHRDGTGVVLLYGDPYAKNARGGRFALCRHVFVSGSGARPSSGWHPGHCDLCGLDMTVDSGD